MFLGIGVGVAAVAVLLILLLVANGTVAPPPGEGSPAAEETTIEAPIGLEAAAAAFAVRLRWQPPEGGPPPGGYEVSRDGEQLDVVDATEFVDGEAVPGQRYVYEVRSLGPDDLVSTPAKVSVKTRNAPPRTARFEGLFNVRVKVLSTSGYEDAPNSSQTGWRFRPRCRAGRCPVRWFDIHANTFQITLRLKGGAYSGSGSGQLNVRCGSALSSSSVTLNLRPTKAGEVDGEWRVTSFEGTFRHTEPAQLGCVTSSASTSVVGRLVD